MHFEKWRISVETKVSPVRLLSATSEIVPDTCGLASSTYRPLLRTTPPFSRAGARNDCLSRPRFAGVCFAVIMRAQLTAIPGPPSPRRIYVVHAALADLNRQPRFLSPQRGNCRCTLSMRACAVLATP